MLIFDHHHKWIFLLCKVTSIVEHDLKLLYLLEPKMQNGGVIYKCVIIFNSLIALIGGDIATIVLR